MPTYKIQSEIEDATKRAWVVVNSNDVKTVIALLDLHMRKLEAAKVEARLVDFHDMEDDFEQVFENKLLLGTETDEFEVVKI